MKTATKINTEYMTFAEWPDGRPSPVYCTRTLNNAERAEIEKNRYMEEVKKNPHLYPKYQRFTVMKRTVITTVSEWEDVPEADTNKNK